MMVCRGLDLKQVGAQFQRAADVVGSCMESVRTTTVMPSRCCARSHLRTLKAVLAGHAQIKQEQVGQPGFKTTSTRQLAAQESDGFLAVGGFTGDLQAGVARLIAVRKRKRSSAESSATSTRKLALAGLFMARNPSGTA